MIKQGMLCHLKSGGPLMTVRETVVTTHGTEVLATWFTPELYDIHEHIFDSEQLIFIPEAEPAKIVKI